MKHSWYLHPPLAIHLNTGGRAHLIHGRTRPQLLVAKFDPEKNRFLPDVTHSNHAVFPPTHSVCTKKLILKRSSCPTIFDFFSGVFYMAQQTPEGEGLLIIEALGSHSDTPHLVRSGRVISPTQKKTYLLQTPTWQHTTLTTYIIHPCPRGIQTHNLSKRVAVDRAATGIVNFYFLTMAPQP